jgi:alginate O-acetyltransferase complex protein AlgI
MPVFASTRNAALALFLSIGLLAIWHAITLNYLLWGLSHVLATLVYRTWVNRGGQTWLQNVHPATRYIGHFLTFHFVVFSWSIIHFEKLDAWILFLNNGLNIHGNIL